MVQIPRHYDRITMNAIAMDENGKPIQVSGTWAFAPRLSWYDHTNKRWIDEWKFTKQPIPSIDTSYAYSSEI